jgi:hypothetical protein
MKRKYSLIIVCATLVFLLATLYGLWSSGHHEIQVFSDTTPVALTIGGKKYSISKKVTSLRLPNGFYTYSFSAQNDGQDITLFGAIDSTANKSPKITIKLSNYTASSLRQALCRSRIDPGEITCEYVSAKISPVFTEDYTWAIAGIALKDGSDQVAVFKLEDNDWVVVSGPSASISGSSSFPSSVREVLSNE